MIEFKDGEKFCRWNGILMTPEKCIELFGTDGEPQLSDDLIEYGDTYYTDLSFGDLLYRIADWYGEIHGDVEDYDEIVNQGHGWADYCAEKDLEHKIVLPDYVLNMKVKPFDKFKEDCPNFNKEQFLAFYNELDIYFDKFINS